MPDPERSEPAPDSASDSPAAVGGKKPTSALGSGGPAEASVEAGSLIATAPAPVQRRPAMGLSGRSDARMTLVGTSLVFFVTLFAWGGAKLSCNRHPPSYEAFKVAPVARLAATPKGGALEFHHRLNTLNFDGALEVVTAEGQELVQKARAACDASCQAQRAERNKGALTRAVLLSRQGSEAVVTAETHFREQVFAKTYRVKWEDRLWKVSGLAE